MHKLKIKTDNENVFTVYYGDQKLAWCQWSPVYEMWRAIMVKSGTVHHVESTKLIYEFCMLEADLDVDTVESVD